MTYREDLLDQYIDALNEGNLDDTAFADDPELRELIATVSEVKTNHAIEWPEFDLPAEMSQSLQQELAPVRPVATSVWATDDGVGPTPTITGGRAGSRHGDDEERNMKWYSKQFAGMAAAALIVISFGIGLTFILGDWGGEIHEPGAFVEEGEIAGTILYVEHDGEHLEDEANHSIARIEADGTNQQELAQRPVPTADRAGFAWSPDGQWIAYVDPESASRDALSVITLVSADGSEIEKIDMEPIEGVMRLNAALTWAADGDHLALVHQDPEAERHQIGILYLSMGEFQAIPPAEGAETSSDGHPAWAPDEWKLAYSRNDGTGRYSINVLHAGMNEGIPVVEDQPVAIQPDWSPDGNELA
jgi:hypothetical protein